MSTLRFQHVFSGLLVLSALSAFVIPPRYTIRFEPQIQAVFAPVSRPAGMVAAWVHDRLWPAALKDQRQNEDIREENERLRALVSTLTVQLDEQRQRNAERAKLGNAGDLSALVKVVGSDTGSRESLALATSSIEGVQAEQYVLCQTGLVGQVERAGLAGAQVRLVTDPSFRIRGRFAHFRRDAKGNPQIEPLPTPVVLVEGLGKGRMAVRELSYEIARLHLHVGDTIGVNDPDCPPALEGQPIGRIISIERRRDAHLLAEIRIEPTANLTRLREVMVMTKEK